MSSRERRLEFAIGRGWWIVPTVYFIGQFIMFFVLQEVTRFRGDSPWDWVLFISLMVGSPTMAAILLSPGFHWGHFAMACAAVMLPGIVFSFEGEAAYTLSVVAAIVTAIQCFVLRLSRVPPWVIRPVRAERYQKASIGWLMGMTVISAVLIALIRVDGDSHQYMIALGYLGLAVLAALIGNVIAVWRAASLRWLVLLLVGMMGWSAMAAADAGIFSLEAWDLMVETNRYVSKIVCLAPAVSILNVVLVHRMMRVRVFGRKRPGFPRVGPKTPVAADGGDFRR